MNHDLNQRGIVSLVAVTLTSFLLLILILGITWLMVGEVRQATDNQNQVVAYYNAESNAELATQDIKKQLTSGAPNSLKQYTGTRNGGSTCDSILGPLPPSVTFCSIQDAGTPYGPVTIAAGGTALIGLNSAATPSGVSTRIDHFAISMKPVGNKLSYMELDMTNYIRSSSAATNTANSTLYFCPPNANAGNARNAACSSGPTVTDSTPVIVWQGTHPLSQSGEATTNLGSKPVSLYNLYPGNNSSYTGVMTLKALTGAMQVTVTAYADDGTELNIQFPTALVEVQDKVGDSTVHLQQSIPIISGGTGSIDVLRGDAGLCQTYSIITGAGSSPLATANGNDTCNYNSP